MNAVTGAGICYFVISTFRCLKIETMSDNSIEIMDNEVNMSYNDNNDNNLSVFWGDIFATTTHPLFKIATDSVSVVTNTSNVSAGGETGGGGGVFESDLIIPLYVVIFVLAIVGNLLVLITLAQNKRMRTVTNVYLLNLVSVFLL